MQFTEWLKSNQSALAVTISLASLAVSLGSLSVVVFKEFIQGPRLAAQMTQINLLRLGDGAKSELLLEMLADDLRSTNPTPSAKLVAATHRTIAEAADREHLLVAIRDVARARPISYEPPRALIEKYFGHKSFFPSFYVPLLVTNSGAGVGHVSALVLIVVDVAKPTARWAFPAWTEVNVPVLLDRSRRYTDVERTKNIFGGLAVPPRGSVSTNPLFLPQHYISNTIISRQNLPPGVYKFTVFGYSPDNTMLFKTQTIEHAVKADELIEMFNGSDSVDFVLLDKHIFDAIAR